MASSFVDYCRATWLGRTVPHLRSQASLHDVAGHLLRSLVIIGAEGIDTDEQLTAWHSTGGQVC